MGRQQDDSTKVAKRRLEWLGGMPNHCMLKMAFFAWVATSAPHFEHMLVSPVFECMLVCLSRDGPYLCVGGGVMRIGN